MPRKVVTRSGYTVKITPPSGKGSISFTVRDVIPFSRSDEEYKTREIAEALNNAAKYRWSATSVSSRRHKRP